MKEGVAHLLVVTWIRCSLFGSLQRLLCRAKVEKLAAERTVRC